jgi:DNA-binding MarR family transcriptional regulator
MVKSVEDKTYADQLSQFLKDFMELQLHMAPVPEDLIEVRQLVDDLERTGEPEHHNVYAALYYMQSFLSRTDKPTMGELSHALSLPASSTKRMVDFLVKSGFCKRLPDTRDKRLVRISLTVNGYQNLRSIEQLIAQRADHMLHHLSTNDQSALFAIFNKIATAIRKDRSL